MIAQRMRIKGLVQGIGYRPFVCEQAQQLNITGTVQNTGGIVIVAACGSPSAMEEFRRRLSEEAPVGAFVSSIRVTELAAEEFLRQPGVEADTFLIITSDTDKDRMPPLIPADLATCPRCRAELADPDNRRYRHPFISCVSCGPRYSIIRELPYDRERITMDRFPMCPECAEEYVTRHNVRRHAQTIACRDCGPVLEFHAIAGGEKGKNHTGGEMTGKDQKNEAALADAIELLKAGGSLAIKDIGGFHLACDARNPRAVAHLRRLKQRPDKPLAVLFLDADQAEDYAFVSEEERQELESPAAPILLLERREKEALAGAQGDGPEENVRSLAPNVCGKSPTVGAMLPCNPIQILLAQAVGPLVMTSGNSSGEMLEIDGDRMEAWMQAQTRRMGEETEPAWLTCENTEGDNPQKKNKILLGILTHDREILTPMDDSILRFVKGRRIMVRRGRGFVPDPVEVKDPDSVSAEGTDFDCDFSCFCAGADMKGTFGYAAGNRVYCSQYFGDLQEESGQFTYSDQQKRMAELFGFQPKKLAVDAHPGYLSRQLARRAFPDLPMQEIYHHQAHIAAVIAEHDLKGEVLGFAFDGTGYGPDGSICGSEVYRWKDRQMEFVTHLPQITLTGGDEGVRNGRIQLDCLLLSFSEETRERLAEDLADQDPGRRQLLAAALSNRLNTYSTSSMGRLFDMVSAWLGICTYSDYEGKAAMELEYAAARAEQPARLAGVTDYEALFLSMQKAKEEGFGAEEIALGFIYAVADWMVQTAEEEEIHQIVLSGGTFLNKILLERVLNLLEEKGFAVYLNEQVPLGDQNISLGQAYLCKNMLRE